MTSAGLRRRRWSPIVSPGSHPAARCTAYTTGARYEVRGPRRPVTPTTYILPDLSWAILLGPILHDAQPGDTIIVYTDAMREHVEQAVRTAGRGDLIVRQQERPPAASWY